MSYLCIDCLYWTGDEDDGDWEHYKGHCIKLDKETLARYICQDFFCIDCRECRDCVSWKYIGQDRRTKEDLGDCKKQNRKRFGKEHHCKEFVQGQGPKCRCYDDYIRYAQDPKNLNYRYIR